MANSNSIIGKRKSDEAFPPNATTAANLSNNLFSSLSDENWKMIAGYASPPEIYNLSLSSVHFFREVTSHDGMNNDNKKVVLATQLLRTSLLSSLGRVLEKSASGITMDAVLKMGELPEGSALIAGSTMVAACLGKDWSGGQNASDVDVYCSAAAAPQVRSWLVEHADGIFVGLNDSYIDFVDSRVLYAVDTNIHHVEQWGTISESLNDRYDYDYQFENETEYRQKTSEWGNGAVEYGNSKWKYSFGFASLGIVPINDGRHDIKPKPGGVLPFDFKGSGRIDLIVAKAGVSTSDLLGGFDLEICKASFDGRKFHIPDPHLTFAGKSKMEPNRSAVVGSYVKHHREPEDRYRLEAIELSRLTSSTIRAVRKEVPNTPFYRLLDVAEALPDTYDPNADFGWSTRGTFYDPIVKAKHGAPVQFHNWCVKLIGRLEKYQKRGIEVVNKPVIPEGFRINKFEIMSHGG